MKRINVKKLILPNIPYVFIALLATKVSEAVRLAPGSDASTKLLNIMTGLNTAFHSLISGFAGAFLAQTRIYPCTHKTTVLLRNKSAAKE